MDWSKAKNVLIAALLVTDIILLGIILGRSRAAGQSREAYLKDAAEFISSRGVELSCEYPDYSEKLPVLFVNIKEGEKKTYAENGMAIDLVGEPGFYAEPSGKGDTSGSIIDPKEAVLTGLSGETPLWKKGDIIEEITLVYWVDRKSIDRQSKEDTAVPAWKIVSGKRIEYVNAYGE